MTWTIKRSIKELARKTEVERVIDQRITQKKAASKLGVTERQFRRILQRYRQEGDGGLVSKKRGKSGNRRTDIEIRDTVREFIEEPIMEGFGPTLMAEKLEEKKGICLSKETVRRMMIEAGVWEAKTKKTEEHHFSRPRRKSRGELVQIDGSEHAWLEERGSKATLLVFVDDATSEILATEFVPEECFFSYGDLCKRYFNEHGLPKSFYSDRFSVFRDNHKGNLSYAGKTYQILTKHPTYYYARQEVLITCASSGLISAWFDGTLLTLEEIEKRPKQGAIVSTKSAKATPLPPAYEHPWRTYGKKINGKPVLTTLLME